MSSPENAGASAVLPDSHGRDGRVWDDGNRRPSRERRRLPLFSICGGLVAVAVVALVFVPLLHMLVTTFVKSGSVTASPIRSAFSLPGIGRSLRNTAILILAGGFLAFLAGTVFAWLNERTDADLGFLGRVMPLAPLLVPPVALSIGWIFLAAPTTGFVNVPIRDTLSLAGVHLKSGPINIYSWPGLIFLYMLELVPYAFLMMSAGFRNLDPSLEEASRTSGASRWQTFTRVSVPAVRPAIGGSVFMIVVVGMAIFSVPSIVGTQPGIDTLSVRIVRMLGATFPPKTGEAVVLSLVMLLVIGLAWLAQRAIVGRGRYATINGKVSQATKVRLGRWRWPARIIVAMFLLCTAVLPLTALLIVSLQPYWQPHIDPGSMTLRNYRSVIFESPLASAALRNSLLLALLGATIGLLAVTTMLVTGRRYGGWRARVLEGTPRIPAGLSHVIVAVSFIALFAGPPFSLAGTPLLLLTCYVIIYLPAGAVNVESALRQIGPELEEASSMSGATRGQTFRRVQLPLTAAGLGAAWTLLFVYIMGDLTASAMLANARTPVIGQVILESWENGLFSSIAALAAIVSVLNSLLVLTALTLVQRSQLSRTSRSGALPHAITTPR